MRSVAYFAGGLDLVLDGGPTPAAAPSTVLDMTVDHEIIRQAPSGAGGGLT